MAYEGYCKVMIPEGRSGDVSVERFEVEDGFGLMRDFMLGRGHAPRPVHRDQARREDVDVGHARGVPRRF